MRALLILVLIAAVGWVLLRGTREQRRAWLTRLNLPGVWRAETDRGEVELVMDGDPDGGRYVERRRDEDGDHVERGRWRVRGSSILFHPDGGTVGECELRLFEPGRIGIHGAGRERRVYERRSDNVIPLPQRPRRS